MSYFPRSRPNHSVIQASNHFLFPKESIQIIKTPRNHSSNQFKEALIPIESSSTDSDSNPINTNINRCPNPSNSSNQNSRIEGSFKKLTWDLVIARDSKRRRRERGVREERERGAIQHRHLSLSPLTF